MIRFFLLSFFLFPLLHFSQQKDILSLKNSSWPTNEFHKFDKKKRNVLVLTKATLYTSSLIVLDRLWYKNYPRSNFHFINDNMHWLQMDKLGHLTTSYHLGVIGIHAYKSTGMQRRKAIWYGGLSGTYFLSLIEMLDGKSEKWGASYGDLLSNIAGSMLAISQDFFWDDQKIKLKFSYSPSIFTSLNPDQLGRTYSENILKDYNGQTYWLSFNLSSFFTKNDYLPKWLNFSLGYSGENMLSPKENYSFNNTDFNRRKRQFFLSLDVDLSKVQTNNKSINNLLSIFGFLKFPAPALELKAGEIYFYPIYY